MVGFDVLLNGKKVSAAIGKGVLTLVLTRLSNDDRKYISLDLTGLDKQDQKRVYWTVTEDLKEGDEIVIKIKNIDQITTPFKTEDTDDKQDKEQMLNNFYALKEKLGKEGLI